MLTSLILMISDGSVMIYKALFALSIFFTADVLHNRAPSRETEKQMEVGRREIAGRTSDARR